MAKFWAWVVGLGVIIGIIVGIINIAQFVNSRTASFSGDVTQGDTANAFIQFLTSHDGKTAWISVTCSDTNRCDIPYQWYEGFPNEDIMPLTTSNGTIYWIHAVVGNSNAEADNGPYGAGGAVFKGYFTISVRGVIGTTPPNVQNVYLQGADSSSGSSGN